MKVMEMFNMYILIRERNHMKTSRKFIISLALVSFLILAFSTAAFAAAVHIECEDFAQFGGEQVGGADIQERESEIIVGSKPDEVGIECYTSFNVELAEPGIYTFKICYSASESTDYVRKGDLVLNGSRYNIPITPTVDWSVYNTAIITADLEAGPLNIKITSPEDYDNEKVKTCNYDWIEYELTEKRILELELELAAEPEPKATIEAVAPVAAQTADVFFGAIITLAVATTAGVTIRKKSR